LNHRINRSKLQPMKSLYAAATSDLFLAGVCAE
jgi:hypothetical protein